MGRANSSGRQRTDHHNLETQEPQRRNSAPRAIACALLAVWAIAGPAVADGTAWQQATAMPFGFGVFEPSISADGRFVAFRSAFNFTGQNGDANFEIFLYDHALAAVTQLTFTGSSYGNFEPAITPDGSAVVFRSLVNFTGGNPDGSFELYEVDVASLAITQLTSTPGFATVSAHSMSADGSSVVYLTNNDGTTDVMRVRRGTGRVTVVSFSPLGYSASQPTVNGDGTRVAFRSNNDFDGSNPDHSLELWRWVEGAGIAHVTQTSSSAQIEAPSIDAAGVHIAFLTRANLAGANPGLTRELFVADADAGTFLQATPSIVVGKHLEPTISVDGSAVLFESDRDLVGDNPDKNRELFRYEMAGHSLVQVTDTIGGASIGQLSEAAASNYVAIAADGWHVAYRSEHELDPGADDPAPQANLELFTGASPNLVVGDLDGDQDVDQADLAILLGAWGASGTPADLDGDGTVGTSDLAILLGAWM